MKPSLASAPTVITCHSNADWDALSSMIGMSMIYPDSIMIFPGSMEKPLNQFFNETAVFLYTFKNIKEIDHASVKRVVVVDTQIRSRVPQVQDLLDLPGVEVEVWDHHPTPYSGEKNKVINADVTHIGTTGSTCTLICQASQERGITPACQEATFLGLGIYGDTGAFTYTSTKPEDFLAGAWLRQHGMDLPFIADLVQTGMTSVHIKVLNELLDSAKARLDEFGRLQYVNQPDIKEARGGLRDSVLVSALAASWLADRPHGIYDEAVERLLDVRDCIHLVAGKDTNLMLTPYQAKVAAMLGLADPTWPENERAAYSIDDLQTLLARIGRRISFSLDSTASRAEHSLTHEKPRFAFFQMFSQRSGGKREAPQFDVVAPGVAKHEGELVLAPGAEPAKDAKLALRMAVAAGEFGLPINPSTLVNLKRCPIHDNQWDDESRELFIRLLACGSNLMEVWESIDFVDIPGRWMPEWLGVRNRPSASAAHRYTIDRHMVEVTSRLGRETPSGGRYDDDHFEALLLAGITHDIGKRAFVADHAAEGARHVPVILKRMGYAPDIVDWATVLVREHLTLSEFATGKDPYDPAVAEELADRLHHDKMLLDMLFDLTRADGSSLGATAGETITKQYGWSKWREQIVRGMYSAARAAM